MFLATFHPAAAHLHTVHADYAAYHHAAAHHAPHATFHLAAAQFHADFAVFHPAAAQPHAVCADIHHAAAVQFVAVFHAMSHHAAAVPISRHYMLTKKTPL